MIVEYQFDDVIVGLGLNLFLLKSSVMIMHSRCLVNSLRECVQQAFFEFDF